MDRHSRRDRASGSRLPFVAQLRIRRAETELADAVRERVLKPVDAEMPGAARVATIDKRTLLEAFVVHMAARSEPWPSTIIGPPPFFS